MSHADITHIIPAHNEEQFLPRTLETVHNAIAVYGRKVDIIVVDNVSTDLTAEIARDSGARVVSEPKRVISAVRNAGAAAATTPIITFADADSMVSENFFVEVDRIMSDTQTVGGNFVVHPDRTSFGIRVSIAVIVSIIEKLCRVGGGSYFCSKEAFDAIGGFDTSLTIAEDINFARRLKKYGKTQRQRYVMSKAAHIVTSMRKADTLGDWHAIMFMLSAPLFMVRPAFVRQKVNDYFYKFDRSNPSDGFK